MILKKNIVPLTSAIVFFCFIALNIGNQQTSGISTSLKIPDEKIYDANPNIYRQEYFNLDKSNPLTKELLPLQHYAEGKGPVIALLLKNRSEDIEKVQVVLRSLLFLKGDLDPEHLAPVLIFNEGDLHYQSIEILVRSTDRPIAFPVVDIHSFPSGFQPEKERANDLWDNQQRIRFWMTTIWKHPVINRFETVMRIDSNSCFMNANDYLPNFMHDGLFYHSPYVSSTAPAGLEFTEGLYDFSKNWMYNIKKPAGPGNPLLFHFIESSWKHKKTLPMFRTTFEVLRRSFMQRNDIMSFHEAISEKEPFDLFRHRWSDEQIRLLMVAMFTEDRRIMVEPSDGFFYQTNYGCTMEKVEKAIRANNLS